MARMNDRAHGVGAICDRRAHATDLPDGASPSRKNVSRYPKRNSAYGLCVSPDRGALRGRHERGVRCGGRGLRNWRVRMMWTAKSWRPSGRCRFELRDAGCEDGDKKAQSRRGEHV